MFDRSAISLNERVFLPYVQRRLKPMNWVDRMLLRARGTAMTRFRPRRLMRRSFISRVDRVARDADALDQKGLLAAAQRLRIRAARSRSRIALRAEALGLAHAAITAQLGISHRPVQILGASLLLDGKLLEMATGEGKSATAALAAAAAALLGRSVHMITVNEYLAERDALEFGPAYARLGLSTGLIRSEMPPGARRRAYEAEIVYVTNSDVAFDYLKDLIALGPGRIRARAALKSAFGDPVSLAPPQPPIHGGLDFAIVDEADSVLVDEAGTPLIISGQDDRTVDPDPYLIALRLAADMAAGVEYNIDREERRVHLTRRGKAYLTSRCFHMDGIWGVGRAREDRVRQALSALHLFERDMQYIVAPGEDGRLEVQIVDEFTGRVMPNRSWEGGLHQMIEVKENLLPTAERSTVARVTYQRFFRQYVTLAAMTGTGTEIAAEMQSFFDLATVKVPLHRPLRRRHLGATLCDSQAEKLRQVARRASELSEAGRAVLIGTRTVAASEAVSEALDAAGVPHKLLNARQNKDEAELIARAGQSGRVTIATNMAGRGTDIKLEESTAARGGLHVILTEYHESRRIDRQLYGRAGRQGDPGSAEDIIARDDPLFQRFAPRLVTVSRAWPANLTVLALKTVMQWRAEREAGARRRHQFELETDLARMISFAGREHG